MELNNNKRVQVSCWVFRFELIKLFTVRYIMNMMFQNSLQDIPQLKKNLLTGVTRVFWKDLSNTTFDASAIE